MERETFERHFAQAAGSARDFARGFLLEELPDAMRFRVRLNQSYDAHASAELELYPEDTGRVFADLSAAEVIDVLWRDGLVPQWIDISVIGETGDATRLELIVCGRYIADETRLYYASTPVAPFGVKGPTLPYPHVEGQRFSVYHRSSCRSLDELERARAHAGDVVFLELEGGAFDDDAVGSLEFPRVEGLWMLGVRVRGDGLSSLERLPKLGGVRLHSTADALDLAYVRDGLQSLELGSMPARVRGAPRAKHLVLSGRHAVEVDGNWPTDGVEWLSLSFPKLPAWIRGSPTLKHWAVDCAASDEDVIAFLATCGKALEGVTLRGQPVTDRVLEALARFPKLQFLDAVDTGITRVALDAFAATRPGLKTLPRSSG